MGIAERLLEVREALATKGEGRARLLAVSKGHPADAIREAYAVGQRDFGENYVQELVSKAEALADLDGIVWHAIGSLQRNKARDVCRVAHVVHTVDRASLIDELDKRASHPMRVFLEVNLAEETQKGGCAPADVTTLAARIASTKQLSLVGLMAIPPQSDDPESSRPHFARLRELRDALVSSGFPAAIELSMGMSSDFAIAIEEGATWIRVGTAIFGERARRAEPT